MGLYDRVIYFTNCPNCGERITEFQTKDAPNPAVAIISLDLVNIFYTICYCTAYIEYKRIYGTSHFHLSDWRQTKRKRKRHGHAQAAYPDRQGTTEKAPSLDELEF